MARVDHALERYLNAQDPVFDQVLDELRAGRKRTHWMWYIFPQIKGLGRSATADHFAVRSLEEARAYLDHPVLGPRLRLATEAVNEVEGRSIHEILGSPDDLKFRSCMTLFARACRDDGVTRVPSSARSTNTSRGRPIRCRSSGSPLEAAQRSVATSPLVEISETAARRAPERVNHDRWRQCCR